MSEQHTPEPWAIDPDDRPNMQWNNHIVSEANQDLAICFMAHDGTEDNEHGEANARRIVAAVNACAGFSIEELEGASLFNDSISAQDEIDSLKSEVEEMKLIIATDTGTESAVANLQQQVSHLVDMVACEKSNAEYFKMQRDELLALLVEFSDALPSDKYMEKQGQTPGPLLQRIRSAIASVKANTK